MSDLAAAKPPRRTRIVLIDADESVRRQLQLALQWHGYEVRSFGTAAPVLQGGYADATDILITDYAPPGSNGIAILRILQSRGWDGRAVLITSNPSHEQERCARASGFAAVLEKPVHQADLIAAITFS
jgi:DNA-binding NtrC family response regulator